MCLRQRIVLQTIARLWVRDLGELYARSRANLERLAPTMTWDHTLTELVAFCRNPYPIALPKRRRALPLCRRLVGYLLWRAAQKLAW